MPNMQNARLDPLAITGFSFKMPQSAVDEASLWNILVNGTNVMSEWPESRANVDAHHDGGSKKPNTVSCLTSFSLSLFSNTVPLDLQNRVADNDINLTSFTVVELISWPKTLALSTRRSFQSRPGRLLQWIHSSGEL